MARASTIVGLLVVALALGAATSVRVGGLDRLSKVRRAIDIDDDGLRSPGASALHMVAMEHKEALADVFWLGIVQEVGKQVFEDEPSYDRLERWANIATDLDPFYYVVYYASAIHLTVYAKRVSKSDELLQKGRRNLPQKWQFPFLLGYNAYFLRAEAALAADYWTMAAELPGAPRFVPSLAARARFQSGDESGAMALLMEMLDFLPEGPHRKDAEIRMLILRSESVLREYDEGCRKWIEERGTFPESSAALLEAGYTRRNNEDELGNEIVLTRKPLKDGSERCVARTDDIRVREFEAKQRLGKDVRPSEPEDLSIKLVEPEE